MRHQIKELRQLGQPETDYIADAIEKIWDNRTNALDPADKLFRKIKKSGASGCTRTELLRVTQDITKKKRMALLEEMIEDKLIRMTIRKTKLVYMLTGDK